MKDILTEKGNAFILSAVGNPLLTNCYLSYNEIIDKVQANEIHCLCYDEITILIHEMDGFQKMYYFLKNPDILFPDHAKKIRKDLKKYPNLEGTVVARIPDKNVYVLEKLGFHPYKEYIRKQLTAETREWCKAVHAIETADIGDLEDIYQLLHGTFDTMSDHLVSKKELHTFLESSRVLMLRIDGELAGVLLFESVGKKSYLRSICIADKFTGKKIGLSLLANYIKRNQKETRLFYLWVESTNERAIILYEKFGYKDDGLREYIYLL